MNKHPKEETYETFDITNLMVLVFLVCMAFICLVHHVDVSHIRFEYKQFERDTLNEWNDLMKLVYPYNYNSKMARSTDISPRKIEYNCNKK